MPKWSAGQIRSSFLSFFRDRGYELVPSSSVLPASKKEQRELVFVNAGMNQFKPRLLGRESKHGSVRKAVNWQRCIRTGGKHNDLSLVGRDGSHLTFFEMLGNWGFEGSVGKLEGCQEAWTLLTEVFGLPKERFIATYFGGDDAFALAPDVECREAWLSIGLPPSRVLPRPMADNFWQMGPSGPCGPCTELHYHHPNKMGASESPSLSQAVELWNLVFMEHERGPAGLQPLPRRHMDTGLGLERLATVLQPISIEGVESVYETDVFQPLLATARGLVSCPAYSGSFADDDAGRRDTNLRILVDHSRMATIALTDGVPICRRGPYFILRRCIRRAAFAALQLRPTPDFQTPVLPELACQVVSMLSEAYPVLRQNEAATLDALRAEEAGFLAQLGAQFQSYSRARFRRPDLTPHQHFQARPPSREILDYMRRI